MLIGIDINQRIEFVSKHDTSEPKTVFVLRPLSGIDMLKFSGGTTDDLVNMLIASLVEIKNYQGSEDITNTLKTLSTLVLGELIQEINKINQLTRQEEKN